MKLDVVRPAADRDIDDAAVYYAGRDPLLGDALYDQVHTTLELLAENPAIGSKRFAHVMRHATLRVWPIGRFPYLLFCFDHPDRIEIIRCLHSHRDLPVALRDLHR